MRFIQSALLLGSTLLCVIFQMRLHQSYLMDLSSFWRWTTIVEDLKEYLKEDHYTYTSTLSSIRGKESATRIPPPTCQFHNIQNRTINRIYFLHMRKAGGSSLRSYFAQVANKHGLKFRAAEGYMQPEQPGHDKNTLYITHVREPIARAISHYKYEKRWDCRTQLQHHDLDDMSVPTLNNTIMSLYNFTRANHSMTHKLWTCASNCYARWASGHPQNIHHDDDEGDLSNNSSVQLQQLEQAARESLWNYNVIIVSEWLQQHPSYVKTIESIFGVKRLNRTKSMTCGKQAAAANQQVPLVVQPHDLELLAKVNQVDLKLYHDLTHCQPQFFDVNTRTIIQWNGTMAKDKVKQLNRHKQKNQDVQSGQSGKKNPASDEWM
jgi:hypothetical protein